MADTELTRKMKRHGMYVLIAYHIILLFIGFALGRVL